MQRTGQKQAGGRRCSAGRGNNRKPQPTTDELMREHGRPLDDRRRIAGVPAVGDVIRIGSVSARVTGGRYWDGCVNGRCVALPRVSIEVAEVVPLPCLDAEGILFAGTLTRPGLSFQRRKGK